MRIVASGGLSAAPAALGGAVQRLRRAAIGPVGTPATDTGGSHGPLRELPAAHRADPGKRPFVPNGEPKLGARVPPDDAAGRATALRGADLIAGRLELLEAVREPHASVAEGASPPQKGSLGLCEVAAV